MSSAASFCDGLLFGTTKAMGTWPQRSSALAATPASSTAGCPPADDQALAARLVRDLASGFAPAGCTAGRLPRVRCCLVLLRAPAVPRAPPLAARPNLADCSLRSVVFWLHRNMGFGGRTG